MPHSSEFPSRHKMGRLSAAALAALLAALFALAGCETVKPPPEPVAQKEPTAPKEAPAPPKEAAPAPAPAGAAGVLRRSSWDQLPDWGRDDASAAWEPFLTSCKALARQEAWQAVCAAAQAAGKPRREAARRFFERHFTPYQATYADGTEEGLITGYYEPLLRGSRKPSARYRYPLFGVPDDLLVIDLTGVYPELKGMRLRGRLEGRRVVPYYNRGEIDQGRAPLAGKELAWVDDPIELFFLQIQGSGRIVLDDGQTLRVGYADQNGHPYRSIGRLLVERGDLPLEKASMQGIQAWARANPARLTELLNHNASFVFFRELPGGLPGPLGALGLPLTARRSVAIDPGFVPLGAPVFIATTWPLSTRPLNQLMLAQDTGGAIRGPVRADFFWGFGADAAREAGRMRQSLRMWVLLPNGYPVPESN